MSSQVRVGFTLIGGGVGTGVYNYLLNLVRVLCDYESNRVQPVLLFGTDVKERDLAPFAAITGAELVLTPVMDKVRERAALFRSVLIGCDPEQQQLFRQQRIDLVFESAQFFGWRVCCPVISWIPDFQHRHLRGMFTRRGYWRREAGFRAQISAGRTIMLSSEDARQDCEKFYPSTIGRTRAVRFAVPVGLEASPSPVRTIAERYNLPEKFFFMPNQLTKHKNHLLVLEALAQLRGRGADVVVVSSGKQVDERHPEYFSMVQARLEELSLQHQMRLLGMIPYEDIIALMQASVAVLNPSLFEGWSTPVEEARALGVPLLLSDLKVHQEQAKDDAIYFDRNSPTALADALQNFKSLTAKERIFRQQAALITSKSRVRRFASEFAQLVTDCLNSRC